jgi:uncharacterized protein
MKKLLLILFIAIGSNTFADSHIDFTLSDFCYEQSNVQERNGVYYFPNQDAGITYISICVYKNANGQYQSKGRLLDGKKDGVWTYWTRYGSKDTQEYWNKGIQEKYTGFYGGLRFEVTYKNGIKNTRQHYDSNDNLTQDSIYNSPEYKAYEKHYSFHDNGNLKSSYTKIDFGDGLVWHGKYETWFEDGQKSEETDYKYGEMVGHWTEWYDNGQMSQDITYNDDGEFDGTLRWWYYNGMLAQVSHYSNGKVLTAKGFDETGKCIQGDCDE